MKDAHCTLLREKLDQSSYDKLMAVDNLCLHEFIADAIELCEPDSVIVFDDSPEGMEAIRRGAIEAGEEIPLAIKGHTVHFDGPDDQGRDREVTRYLVPSGDVLAKTLNQIERQTGLEEVRGLLRGAMRGRTMIVRLMCLGPTGSQFSIPCVECTDSWYVSHALNLLYRPGYEEFRRLGPDVEFFRILHSSGRVDARMVSVDADKKRVYIDYMTNTVYSVNTQYAGNTVGLKKLALRLTIRKADREGWLAEHMFVMGAHGPNGRKTYLAGAFPSGCGKTATAMLRGETILGDDIAYFHAVNGECRAVNAERGVFGIIQNVNPTDDPIIWDVLTKPGEVIFSNVLVKDGKPYWLGMGQELPDEGINFVGQWRKGMKNGQGNVIPPAHQNARYAVALEALANCDPELHNPEGVVLRGIIYGGRDARCYPPVQQAFDWEHGIIAYGAWLETETTFAIVGEAGVPEIDAMSIQDFVSICMGKYIQNNLDFARQLDTPPLVFGVNYFLQENAHFVNAIQDKHVWVKWMERRVHDEAGAVMTPTGWIPTFEDLTLLFREVLGKPYTEEHYVKQFSARIPENLGKIQRVEHYYRTQVLHTPARLYEILEAQRRRLKAVQKELGDRPSPFELAKLPASWWKEVG